MVSLVPCREDSAKMVLHLYNCSVSLSTFMVHGLPNAKFVDAELPEMAFFSYID